MNRAQFLRMALGAAAVSVVRSSDAPADARSGESDTHTVLTLTAIVIKMVASALRPTKPSSSVMPWLCNAM